MAVKADEQMEQRSHSRSGTQRQVMPQCLCCGLDRTSRIAPTAKRTLAKPRSRDGEGEGEEDEAGSVAAATAPPSLEAAEPRSDSANEEAATISEW